MRERVVLGLFAFGGLAAGAGVMFLVAPDTGPDQVPSARAAAPRVAAIATPAPAVARAKPKPAEDGAAAEPPTPKPGWPTASGITPAPDEEQEIVWTPRVKRPSGTNAPPPLDTTKALPADVIGVEALFSQREEGLASCMTTAAPAKVPGDGPHVAMEVGISPVDGVGKITSLAVAHEKDPTRWAAFVPCVQAVLQDASFAAPAAPVTVQWPIWRNRRGGP